MSIASFFGTQLRSRRKAARRGSRPVLERRYSLQLEHLEDRLALSGGVDPHPLVTFTNVSDWGSGFQGAISVVNRQSTPITNWQLSFDFARNINSIWDGVITSHVGNHYVISNASYDGNVASGGKLAFGFVGSVGNLGSATPTNYSLSWTDQGNPPPPPPQGSTVAISFLVNSDWGSGFTGTINIKNTGTTAINGWNLQFDFAHAITSIWNATISAHQGLRYTLQDAGYNRTIAPGQTVSVGFNGTPGNVTDQPANYAFNGVALGGSGSSGPPASTLSINDVQVVEGNPPTGTAGFLHTVGNQIVDANNKPVKIAGVNWFGMETTTFAPDGLWARNYKDMINQMVQLGFNTIRLPFSDQLFDANSVPTSINYSLNPDLVGLKGLGLLDKIVSYAGQIGLRIMLDHHRSEAGSGAEGSGLWYTSAYPESRWISDWTMLASHYANNPTVIGADLANEPHGPADWGNGDANDWRLAAERAGNAILAVNPNWLIIVEGVETGKSGSYWWGGNLSNAGQFPVVLNQPGHLVYSPHDYPASVFPQSWFSAANYPNNLPGVWDANWGYLFRTNTAPILLGEFGSTLQTASDQTWAAAMVKYLAGDLNGDGKSDLAAGQQGMSWTWWSWNPNSGDTGGILQDDWTSVNQNKVNLLQPIEFGPLGSSAGPGGNTALFTVTLSAASSQSVTVNYATADGTAKAGQDYVAASGSLTFAPGETQKTIAICIIGDLTVEPNETFTVNLTNPVGATLAKTFGTGTILNDD